jgi:hypothetical protein
MRARAMRTTSWPALRKTTSLLGRTREWKTQRLTRTTGIMQQRSAEHRARPSFAHNQMHSLIRLHTCTNEATLPTQLYPLTLTAALRDHQSHRDRRPECIEEGPAS